MNPREAAKPRLLIDQVAYHTPIYLEDWWWNIASSGKQGRVAVCEDGSEVGRLSYFAHPRYSKGFRNLTEGVHAPWTRYCAPVIDHPACCTSPAREGDIAYKLACQLPRGISYRLTCPHYTNSAVLLAFKRAGFEIGIQKSYLLDLRGAGDAKVAAQLDMSTRQRFRKAEKLLDVVEIEPSTFFRLYAHNLSAREKTSYEDLDVAESLATTCRTRGSGRIRITAAKGKNAENHNQLSYYAAIACLQDDIFSYYWLSTRTLYATDPAIRNGAVKLLIVDAIAHASREGLIFDFDGAATDGSGELYRGFRSAEVDRFVLTRETVSTRLIEAARPVLSAIITKVRTRSGRSVTKWEGTDA
jgi:hypothetical protein